MNSWTRSRVGERIRQLGDGTVHYFRRTDCGTAGTAHILPSLLFAPSTLSSLVLHLLIFSGASREELDGPSDKWPTVVTPWGRQLNQIFMV
jgi:hypothetical protein